MSNLAESQVYNIVFQSFFETRKGNLIMNKGIECIGLSMYLYTVSNQVGIFHISKESIKENLNISERKFKQIINYLTEIDFLHFSEKYSIIYIVDMLAFNVKPLDTETRTKQVRILKAQLNTIPDNNEFKKMLYNKYKETHGILFTKYIESNVQKDEELEKEKEETVVNYIDVYNLATEQKGHRKARLTKHNEKEIEEIKKEGITLDIFADKCITEKFENIKELLSKIKEENKMNKLEDYIVSKKKEEVEGKENEEREEQLLSDISENTELFIDNKNKEVEDVDIDEMIDEIFN